MDGKVSKVVIVGRDAAAWLAALALQQRFGQGPERIEVELVELPSALRRQDAYLALPAQQALHRLLGLDETRLLRACAGLYSLGQRFSNWSGPDTAFLHAYDTHGISLSHVGFFQYWLKARAQGLKVPLEDFSLGAAAAKEGRFVVLDDATRAFSNATYGYNLGARDYLRAIGKVAVAAGLKHTVGQPAAVETADGAYRRAQAARRRASQRRPVRRCQRAGGLPHPEAGGSRQFRELEPLAALRPPADCRGTGPAADPGVQPGFCLQRRLAGTVSAHGQDGDDRFLRFSSYER